MMEKLKKMLSYLEKVPVWVIIAGAILIFGILKLIFTELFYVIQNIVIPYFNLVKESINDSDFFAVFDLVKPIFLFGITFSFGSLLVCFFIRLLNE